ncbi:hypothetical protein QUF70_17175 [Desulfobacterales bacterium HSG17]|nr:hypothetical protein [Desulfobacterales bacterium HSG17]
MAKVDETALQQAQGTVLLPFSELVEAGGIYSDIKPETHSNYYRSLSLSKGTKKDLPC